MALAKQRAKRRRMRRKTRGMEKNREVAEKEKLNGCIAKGKPGDASKNKAEMLSEVSSVKLASDTRCCCYGYASTVYNRIACDLLSHGTRLVSPGPALAERVHCADKDGGGG